MYTNEEFTFITTKPFIRVEYDYWYEQEPQSHWRDVLNERAKLVLFPSPLHRDIYQHRHRYAIDHTGILPPPMNSAEYTPYRQRWDQFGRQHAIWYGEWHWFKGPDIAMKWALHNQTLLHMYSPTMPEGQQSANKFVEICGFAPEERWLDIIASHNQFVHMPREPQCFPYSMLEAYLFGCEVVVAGRMGVESYFGPHCNIDDVVEMADQSNTKLWEIALDYLS